ncbi:Uncharacterised protein [Mycobacteroides abscessus subsp. abscessus]|nr:Uncharacterised protein [Mycobacteroides abscessus subsp. abscessus]SKO02556.1 Uncharacterised protein [Mycobacteroides abscessus subsp. massiliense]
MTAVTILHRRNDSAAVGPDDNPMWRRADRIAAAASIGLGIASGLVAGTITYVATGRHSTGSERR